jgi:hypothetical protein
MPTKSVSIVSAEQRLRYGQHGWCIRRMTAMKIHCATKAEPLIQHNTKVIQQSSAWAALLQWVIGFDGCKRGGQYYYSFEKTFSRWLSKSKWELSEGR